MGFSAVPEEGYLPQDLLRTRKELTEMGAPKYEPPPSRPHPPARGAEGYRWYGYYRPARRVRRGNCLRASLPERRGRPAREVVPLAVELPRRAGQPDRKSTRLNSSHVKIS